MAVRLLGEQLVLWRADGAVAAAMDRCPHRESPLSTGVVRDGCISCPYHGWTFDPTGACVGIPSSGPQATIPPKARLASVQARERYGLVWLCLDEPADDIPSMPWDDDPAYRRLNNPVEVWACAATRMVDNFLDYSHFPYVHRGSFGEATDPEVAPVELGPLSDGFHGYEYQVQVDNSVAEAAGASGQTAEVISRHMSTGWVLPFAVRSTIEYQTGLHHILLLLSTPIDDTNSYFTFVVWRNDDFSEAGDEILRLDRLIGAEDKFMLEQLRGTLPLDATSLVSVQSDRASVEWKRRLRALLA